MTLGFGSPVHPSAQERTSGGFGVIGLQKLVVIFHCVKYWNFT